MISKAHIPKANTPKANIPKANTPKADTPKANSHKTDTPKANSLKNANTPIFRQNSQFSEERKEGSQKYEAKEETKSQSIRKGSHDKNKQFDNCEVIVTVVRNGGRIIKTEQTHRPNSAKNITPTQQVFPLKKTKSQIKSTKNNEAIDISQFKKQNNVNSPQKQIKYRKQNQERPKSTIINQLVAKPKQNRPKSVQKVQQINKIEISELKQENKNKTQKTQQEKQQKKGEEQIVLVNSISQQIIPNSNSNGEDSPQKILESFLNSKLIDQQPQMGESKLHEQLSLTVSQVSEQPIKQSRFIKQQK